MNRFYSLLILPIIFFSCENAPKGYSKFSGTLKNNKDSVLSIFGYRGYAKKIKINADGSFSDTMQISAPGIYTMQTSATNRAPVFLDNGFNLKLEGDANEFLTSFKFSGKGSVNSNYIVSQVQFGRSIPPPDSLNKLEKKDFELKLKEIESGYENLISSYSDLDTNLVSNSKRQTSDIIFYLRTLYERNQKTGLGRPSPAFVNYKNFKGGTSSLDDFKGNFVYVDVWATWCAPCIAEIPYLKKLEKEYKNKNIKFVSISADEPRRSGGSWEAAEKKWKDFVKQKNLKGVQLWAGRDISFMQAYEVNAFPRFILIDDKGLVRAFNAPRPSDPALKTLLKSVGLKDKK